MPDIAPMPSDLAEAMRTTMDVLIRMAFASVELGAQPETVAPQTMQRLDNAIEQFLESLNKIRQNADLDALTQRAADNEIEEGASYVLDREEIYEEAVMAVEAVQETLRELADIGDLPIDLDSAELVFLVDRLREQSIQELLENDQKFRAVSEALANDIAKFAGVDTSAVLIEKEAVAVQPPDMPPKVDLAAPDPLTALFKVLAVSAYVMQKWR